MSSSTPKCLVRGSLNVDEFFDLPHIVRPGETISSTGLTKRAGGKGANQAYALAKAGGSVTIDGNVGLDGKWVKEMLSSNRVDVSRLNVVEEEVTGRAVIQRAADGENSIVLHKGANFHLTPSQSSPNLDGFTHLLLQNEIPLSDTVAYLRLAGKNGLTTLFNPSPMLTPDELRAFPWSDLDWLVVNEGEIQDLLSAFGTSTSAGAGELSAEESIKALFESGAFDRKIKVICTLGAEGVMWAVDGKGQDIGRLPAGRLINGVKDTTGAGDCFLGYLTAGLMRGEALEAALQNCLAACAICVENEGAMDSMPTLAEAQARATR